MRYWLRVFLRRFGYALAVAVVYGGFSSVMPLVRWQTGVHDLRFPPGTPGPDQIAGMLLVPAAALYGLWRVLAFHPAWHAPYRRWLETTPWTPGAALPFQPLHLVWWDAVLLAMLTLFALRHPEMHPARPLVAFGFTYLMGTAFTLWVSGTAAAVVAALLAALPAVLIARGEGWWVAVLLAVMYPLAAAGTRRALAKIPWKPQDPAGPRPESGSTLAPNAAATARLVGWPMAQLSPAQPAARPGVAWAFVLSVLAGWWAYAAARLAVGMDVPATTFAWPFAIAIPLVVASLRLMPYGVGGYAPPISVFGRLATGRLIIPGYDKIFVAPLCVLLVGFELARLLTSWGVCVLASGATVLAVSLFLAMTIGPSLADWRLTGNHRIFTLLRQQSGNEQRTAAGGGAQERPA